LTAGRQKSRRILAAPQCSTALTCGASRLQSRTATGRGRGRSSVGRPLWVPLPRSRAMYERIEFTHEIGTNARTCLEWEGVFAGKPVAGATIIARDDRGAITSVRLHHRPFDQVVAFAETISRRLG